MRLLQLFQLNVWALLIVEFQLGLEAFGQISQLLHLLRVDLSFFILFLASASAAAPAAGPPSQGLIGGRDGQEAAGEKKRRSAAHRPSEIPHRRPQRESRLEDFLMRNSANECRTGVDILARAAFWQDGARRAVAARGKWMMPAPVTRALTRPRFARLRSPAAGGTRALRPTPTASCARPPRPCPCVRPPAPPRRGPSPRNRRRDRAPIRNIARRRRSPFRPSGAGRGWRGRCP